VNRWLLIALVAMLALAPGCAAQQGLAPAESPSESPAAEAADSPEPTPSDSPEAEVTPEESDKVTGDPEAGDVPASVIEEMKADAADRAGTDPDAVEVVSAEAVTWNDGSLGCPDPGEGYIQALTPGYHVILEASGQEYDYRADDRGYFKLCDNPDGSQDGGIVDY
jgi:hypothetical protein